MLTKSYAGKSIKGLEKSTQNNILQKQNQELRQKVREMRFKINNLLNKIKSLRIGIQRAENDKQKFDLFTNLIREFIIVSTMLLISYL